MAIGLRRQSSTRHAKRWSCSRAGKLHDEDAYASGNQNLGLESSMSMHHTEMNSQLLRHFLLLLHTGCDAGLLDVRERRRLWVACRAFEDRPDAVLAQVFPVCIQ